MAEILTYAQLLTNGREAIGSAEKFANQAAGYSTPTNLEQASNVVTAAGITNLGKRSMTLTYVTPLIYESGI